MLGLFDPPPPNLPDRCPYCSAPVLECFVDTGSPMRAEPMDDGPYVLESDGDLRFLAPGGRATLLRGNHDHVGRKVPASEQRWGSHYHTCPKRDAWGPPRTAALRGWPTW